MPPLQDAFEGNVSLSVAAGEQHQPIADPVRRACAAERARKRKEVSLALLPTAGEARKEAEAALRQVLEQHWPVAST